MAQPMLAAHVRTEKGKEAAKKLRRSGKIPAVFYGPKSDAVMLQLDVSELSKIIREGGSENVLLDLRILGEGGEENKTAMLKEVVVDPVSDIYIHADLYEIAMDREITVNIPITLVNSPAGVELGGVLQQVRREIAVSCLPNKLVDAIEADVADLQIGDSLHIEDLVLPDGITVLEEEHLTVAVVAAPTREEEEVAEEEAVEEEEGAEAASAAEGEEAADTNE